LARARRQGNASGGFLKCRENNACGLTKARENHRVHMYVNTFQMYVRRKFMTAVRAVRVKKVSVTTLRGRLKGYMKQAKGRNVVLINNRRQESKYLVDKDWLDTVMRERESILATLQVLADRELTNRLLKLAETVDEDVRAGRLHTMEEVFGES